MIISNTPTSPLSSKGLNDTENFRHIQGDLTRHKKREPGHSIIVGYHRTSYSATIITNTIWADVACTVPRYRMITRLDAVSGEVVSGVATYYKTDGIKEYELKYTNFVYEVAGDKRLTGFDVEEKFYD